MTLPSNASLDVYRNNSISCFRVELAQPLHLKGRWEVALTEISYPHSWYNVTRERAFFEWRAKDSQEKVHRYNFREGYYQDFNQLKTELESCFRKIDSDVYFSFSHIKKRLHFEAGGQTHLRFFPPVSYMLGVESGVWNQMDRLSAPFPVDMKSGFYQLFCYSDVITHQIVGDVHAPLLQTIKVAGSFGDILTHRIISPDYLAVAKNYIDNIQVEIKTDQNVPVKFTYGKVILRLHFRPVRRFENPF